MARRNSRFVNQKIIIGNKSIQAGDLTDSAKDTIFNEATGKSIPIAMIFGG